jgi:hypothetical protein
MNTPLVTIVDRIAGWTGERIDGIRLATQIASVDARNRVLYGGGAPQFAERIWINPCDCTECVRLPRSFSGIVGGTMLGLGRAIGETMAAAMLVGASQRQDWSLFFPGDTMAGHIANTFQDAAPETVLGLMAIGVALFVFTTNVNVAARLLVWRVGRGSGDAGV